MRVVNIRGSGLNLCFACPCGHVLKVFIKSQVKDHLCTEKHCRAMMKLEGDRGKWLTYEQIDNILDYVSANLDIINQNLVCGLTIKKIKEIKGDEYEPYDANFIYAEK